MKFESTDQGGKMETFWGVSNVSYDEAIQAAVATAKKALPQNTLEWIEVLEFRGGFDNGELQFQVAIRIGFA
jgi:flavin-binding protein dodecin